MDPPRAPSLTPDGPLSTPNTFTRTSHRDQRATAGTNQGQVCTECAKVNKTRLALDEPLPALTDLYLHSRTVDMNNSMEKYVRTYHGLLGDPPPKFLGFPEPWSFEET